MSEITLEVGQKVYSYERGIDGELLDVGSWSEDHCKITFEPFEFDWVEIEVAERMRQAYLDREELGKLRNLKDVATEILTETAQWHRPADRMPEVRDWVTVCVHNIYGDIIVYNAYASSQGIWYGEGSEEQLEVLYWTEGLKGPKE